MAAGRAWLEENLGGSPQLPHAIAAERGESSEAIAPTPQALAQERIEFDGGAPETIERTAATWPQAPHLKGTLKPGGTSLIFQLPPGFRPASGKFIQVAATCAGGPCSAGTFPLTIFGPGVITGLDGGVVGFTGGTFVGLEGVTFRAES